MTASHAYDVPYRPWQGGPSSGQGPEVHTTNDSDVPQLIVFGLEEPCR